MMQRTTRIATIIISLITSFTGDLFAQQDKLFSQYMFTLLSINPAYAGSTHDLNATVLYRKQWIGLEGGPSVQLFNINAPINYERIGLGLQVITENQNFNNRLAIEGDYAYKIKINNGIMSFGIYGGAVQYSIDYSKLVIKDPDEVSNTTRTKPDFGTGIYYQHAKFYGGMSVRHLMNFGSQITIKDPQTVRQYYLVAGYKFKVTDNLEIIPSTLIKKAVNSPWQGDFTSHFFYKKTIWVGASYRTGKIVIAQTGINISQLFNELRYDIKLGYAYDITLSPLKGNTRGTHELMATINYEIVGSTKRLEKRHPATSPLFF